MTAPLVGWVPPDEVPGLGVGESIRAGWRLTRANLGPLLGDHGHPGPAVSRSCRSRSWAMTTAMFDSMFNFWANVDWSRYADDPDALQRDMQAAMQPSTDLAVAVAIGGGLSFVIWMIGTAAISAALIEATTGRRPSVTGAYRAVFAHSMALVVPAVILGLGYAVIIGPVSFGQSTVPFDGSPSARAGLGVLLSFVGLAIQIAVIYLVVRWALYFQAVLAEDHGVRGALRRSSELTHGIRIKIALIFLVVGILAGLVFGLVVVIAGFAAGILAGSLSVGFAVAGLAVVLCALVYLPFYVAVLTYIYRRRTEVDEAEADEPGVPPRVEPSA